MRNRSVVMVFAMIVAIQLFASTPTASAQSKDDRPATGSISGVVTKDGKPAAGVGVLLVERSDRGWGAGDTVERVRSDKEGKFTFEGLERGSYGLDAFLPGAFIQDSTPWDGPVQITLGDGESVTGVKLELERGGVITGKLVDGEGRPVAGETIHVCVEKPAEDGSPTITYLSKRWRTDDRGIYRIFGLSPGSYAVGAGSRPDGSTYWSDSKTGYALSFHGGSSTPDAAKLVAVGSGTEARDIDIVVRRDSPGFTITGRVVDSETKNPVTNVWIARGPMVGGRLTDVIGGGTASEDGSFAIVGVDPGSYGVVATAGEGQRNSYTCDPVPVTVSDGDVKDVVIEMQKAATLSGRIVALETDRNLDVSAVRNSHLYLHPVQDPGSTAALAGYEYPLVRTRPDLTFECLGLREGAYRPFFAQYSPAKGFYVARVEIDGIPLSGPIRIDEIGNVANVSIVVGRTTSIVRGRVKLINGSVPFDHVTVTLRRTESGNPDLWPQIDSTGAFQLESVPPGEYSAVAGAIVNGRGKSADSKAVTISVGREGTTHVDLEIDLGSGSGGNP